MRIPIDSIDQLNRIRRDLGDLDSLKQSIGTCGLLHPVVVVPHPDPDQEGYKLIAGARRIAAVQELGDDEIEATIAQTLVEVGTELIRQTAEHNENECRLGFTAQESMEAIAILEPPLRAEAIERNEANRRDVGQYATAARLNGVGHWPTPLDSDITAGQSVDPQTDVRSVFHPAGTVRDNVAKALGVGDGTAKRLLAINHVRQDEEAPQKVKDDIFKASSINSAFKLAKSYTLAEEASAPVETSCTATQAGRVYQLFDALLAAFNDYQSEIKRTPTGAAFKHWSEPRQEKFKRGIAQIRSWTDLTGDDES